MKRLLLLAAFFPFAIAHPTMADSRQRPTERVRTERLPGAIDTVDLVVSYEPGPPAANYEAEAGSDVPDTDPYAIERGANKGLIFLKAEGGRQVKRYSIAKGQIRAIVRVKPDMTVLERADLVFTGESVVLIHTFTSNAGIFTSSDIYPLAYERGRVVDRRHLIHDPGLLKMLAIGAAFYNKNAPSPH
jgi:hypothetical protein